MPIIHGFAGNFTAECPADDSSDTLANPDLYSSFLHHTLMFSHAELYGRAGMALAQPWAEEQR
ncbi:MAG TPA: hypothetical protein VGC99_21845 [Candidatus Tectomicrobia bacterium]